MFVLLSQMVMSGLWNKKKNANRARMKEVICKYAYIDIYIYIVQETLTLAVLCFKTFPN